MNNFQKDVLNYVLSPKTNKYHDAFSKALYDARHNLFVDGYDRECAKMTNILKRRFKELHKLEITL